MRIFGSVLLLASGAIAISGRSAAAGDPSAAPVVVELFTSQGCSSCPPADRLLGRLAGAPGVIPLAFHVDYWNHGGWSDPFSRAQWTARQEAYVRRFGLDAAYTPQAVVAGRLQLVGSREDALRRAIASASADAGASVVLRVRTTPGGAVVEGNVDRPAALRDRNLEVMVAIFETGLVTAVRGGENGGETLRDENVVRALDRAAKIPRGGDSPVAFAREVRLDAGWNRGNLGVAAFVQDPATLEIVGAASARVPSVPAR